MIFSTSNFSLINWLGEINPGAFFVISLIPYIYFLIWAQKSNQIPKLSLLGFRLTLLFVFMTIVLAIVAKVVYLDELTNIDLLHGGAESFLTISDALILSGFIQLISNKEVKNS
tara:strand:- start:1225 stop:1566 length:342 start_codon:yes stop_codon:yes gene_type:complete